MRMSQPNRRRLVHLAVTAALLPITCPVWPSAIHAQERYEVFFPLLVDLPDWRGSEPHGIPIMKVVGLFIAMREYQRGDARLVVSVTAGLPKRNEQVSEGTAFFGDARITISTIDGWQVFRTFNVKEKEVGVQVTLAPNAYFRLIFINSVAEDEALTLARRFDWKALQAAVPPP
jgi:hypothetical protein